MTPHEPNSVELLARLVSFDTTSRNSNLELVSFIEDFLTQYGITPVRVDYEPGKANIFASIGPAGNGGIVLSGHTDVVPVDGQNWTANPFELREAGGRLYGRGTCDMKGFVACCLAAVPKLVRGPLSRPVHLVFSCDEEVSCNGVLPVVRRMGRDFPQPSVCFVGEPTMMEVGTGQKACQAFTTSIAGV